LIWIKPCGPGWVGNHIGFYPFPTSIADEARGASALAG
jgi:hypothetical protein